MGIARIGLKYIVVIWLLVILSVGSVIFAGYHRNRVDLRRLLVNEAESLVTMAAIAANSSIHALDEVEQLTSERLLDNARNIERMTRTKIPSQSELEAIATANGLHAIAILSKSGNVLVRRNEREDLEIIPGADHRLEVLDVLEGATDSRIIGFMENSYNTDMHYGVVVGGDTVGAIVVTIDSGKMLDFRKAVGLGTMFRDIGEAENIRYIALQDSIGILAASPGITQLTSIRDDPFLMGVVPDTRVSRFIDSNGGKTLEIVAPLIVDDYNLGLLRIGLDTGGFQEIADRSERHFFILFLIAAASVAFLFMYTMLRQNYTLLNHEHDRILTDVRRMEEESQRTERLSSMGRLASGVAHEIRNPLNAISMLVQLLGSEFVVRENQQRYTGFIDSITKEIKRISVIVENFLTYARPQKLKPQTVALAAIVDEVLSLVKESAISKNITISATIDPDITCLCDIDQIKQVVLNLLLNAIEAVDEEGKVKITAGMSDDQVIMKITDTGTGIAAETISSIFDPYFTTKQDGSGLGLSEVHRIVSMHGGTVHAKSSDEGAIFTVTLPHHGNGDDSKNYHS